MWLLLKRLILMFRNYLINPTLLFINIILSPQEHKALYELQSNKDKIIKRSDKVGAVVVWHYDKYIKEAHCQLQNTH